MSKYQCPPIRDMFGDVSTSLERAQRFEDYNTELDKALSTPRSAFGTPHADLAKQIDDSREFLAKSVNPSAIESVRSALASADLAKDGWTTTSPLSTGLVAYDLVPAALVLAPRPTPLRNRLSRTRGQGLNKQFKRITGFSGSGTGGVAGGPIRHGINESTTNTFGPGNIAYARGPKIAYAADERVIPYIQTGLSDEVSFAAQFGGASFDDIRRQSATALLYATMLSDERMLLGGRGTKTGFAGALAAPTGVNLTKRAAATNEVGASGSVANVYVYVTAVAMFGESAPSAVATVASVVSGNVVDVTFTDVPGALGYHVYLGTTTGPTNAWSAQIANSSAARNARPAKFDSQGYSTVAGSPITISFTGAGASGVPNSGPHPPTADTSAVADEYDGILTYLGGSESGYVRRLNNSLSAAGGGYANNPGGEFQDAFAALYDSVKADPDELLFSAPDRVAISDLLKTQSSSSYRITVDNSSEVHNAKLGSVVTGLQNESTGRMTSLTVHPWMPQGNVAIQSWSLPLPDSNIPGDCWSVSGPQDLMQISWPVSQLLYEASTWQFNSLIAYAPAWSGCIQGIFTP